MISRTLEGSRMNIIALDIETSGLDPNESTLLAVALYSDTESRVLIGHSERDLLLKIENLVECAPAHSILVTWNGEEFDLPFLARRFELHGLLTGLEVIAGNRHGKYGGTRFTGRWGDLDHVDVAGLYQSVANELSVPWSLKPVSRRVLGLEPIEVPRDGASIASMSEARLHEYVESDARITYLLARRILIPETLLLPEVG
jgi:DNA polymerase elongation subunit (family B)